ncbi:MAG: penicillin-binding protein 2 [Lautropia sp.]|nr:penicillin-binding protein 2 [Lautropia sp.]
MRHPSTSPPPPFFRRRLWVAMLAVGCAFGGLGARAWYLQVASYANYHALAEENRITMRPLAPQRGRIVDRNGIVLAEDIYAPALEIAPNRVKDIDQLIEALGRIIPISALEKRRFQRLLPQVKHNGTIPLKTRLTDEEVARIAAVRFQFDGIDITARPRRHYPLGSTAAHAIGHIGRISASDNEQLQKDERASNYAGSTHIGKLGLEQSYESQLHGRVGVEEVEVTASGRPVRSLSKKPATPGQSLQLSLDIRLQQLAEKLFGDQRGALVAIEPATGQILAFVSMPSFDPNLFVDGIDTQNWQRLNEDPNRPLLNRPLRGTYPPGSTYKPFMAMAIAESGVRKPEEIIQDPGYFMLGKHRFRDSKPSGHGRVDLHKSIVVSSDTYYYGASLDLGVDRIHQFMKPWGFGQLTGIDLPDESAGILPSSQWKRARFKQPWYPGETPSVGIGQGYNSFTILQLAHATATLANDGVPNQPHLVTHIGQAQRAPSAGARPAINVSSTTLKRVQRAMIDVTLKGTGRIAFQGAEYLSAGKTGTSQVIGIRQNEKYDEKRIAHRHRDHSLYIGYAPADKPRIALAVVVENGGFGARVAAPLARQLFDFYLLGKLPAEAQPERPDEASTEEGSP